MAARDRTLKRRDPGGTPSPDRDAATSGLAPVAAGRSVAMAPPTGFDPRGVSSPALARSADEGRRGDRLLADGDVAGARQVFDALSRRLSGETTPARVAALGQFAHCLRREGELTAAAARLDEALAVAGALATTPDVTALRLMLLSERGETLRLLDRHDEARRSHESALALAESIDDARAQAVELAHLGHLASASRQWHDALDRYARALSIATRIGDAPLEGRLSERLGELCHEHGDVRAARQHHAVAARVWREAGDRAAAARSQSALATIATEMDDPRAAEAWHRVAIEGWVAADDLDALSCELTRLGVLLRRQPSRLDEAERSIRQAIAVGHRAGPQAAVWSLHELLAGIDDERHSRAGDDAARERWRASADVHRHLAHQAPRIVAALERNDGSPGFARAALVGALGRCFGLAGDWHAAAECLSDAVSMLASPEGDDGRGVAALHAQLESQWGEALMQLRQPEAAGRFAAAAERCRQSGDARGEALNRCHLGACAAREDRIDEAVGHFRQAHAAASAIGDEALLQRIAEALREHAGADAVAPSIGASPLAPSNDAATADAAVAIVESSTSDFAFEPDLLLDGPAECRMRSPGRESMPDETSVPSHAPGSRIDVGDDGAWLCHAPDAEPTVTRRPGCIVMERTARVVRVASPRASLRTLMRAIDGRRTLAELVEAVPVGEREATRRTLSALIEAGVLDASGRTHGRTLHAWTKKGVLPGGSLGQDEVLALATDGDYRRYDAAPAIALAADVPPRLQAFHALTRARRSRRDFNGAAVSREDFDALLTTACGVTGELPWSGRRVALRAYPSSGALYAVEIYPVVLRVDGLAPSVCHLRAADRSLEVVDPALDVARFVEAALPVEREMVGAAAAMICLVGHFPRHERKYGEGGYRMMVAEAGHVSQNLLMSATALGLAARPFGGVFDDLVNADLRLDPRREQFLLGVLVGRTDDLDAGRAA